MKDLCDSSTLIFPFENNTSPPIRLAGDLFSRVGVGKIVHFSSAVSSLQTSLATTFHRGYS